MNDLYRAAARTVPSMPIPENHPATKYPCCRHCKHIELVVHRRPCLAGCPMKEIRP